MFRKEAQAQQAPLRHISVSGNPLGWSKESILNIQQPIHRHKKKKLVLAQSHAARRGGQLGRAAQ